MPPNNAQARADFERLFDVSRETMVALDKYLENLETWAHRINLVSLTTLDEFWERHAIDCAQLLKAAGPKARNWVDFGSGAGFPGLIVAALLAQKDCTYSVTLIDTNIKRCTFLAESARILGVKVNVINKKVGDVAPFNCDIVTARAFTNLESLLGLSLPYFEKGARLLFLKGESVQDEVAQASTKYSFEFTTTPSLSHSTGQIIEVTDLNKIDTLA